jgi:hypothetical protein
MSVPEETKPREETTTTAAGYVASVPWGHGFRFSCENPCFRLRLSVYRIRREPEKENYPAEVTRGGCSASREHAGTRHSINQVRTEGRASYDGMLVPVRTEDQEDGPVTLFFEMEPGEEFTLVPVLSYKERLAVKEVLVRGGSHDLPGGEFKMLESDSPMRFVQQGQDSYYDIRGDKAYIMPHKVFDREMELEFFIFTGRVHDGHEVLEESTRNLVARVVVSPTTGGREDEVTRGGPLRGRNGPASRRGFDV